MLEAVLDLGKTLTFFLSLTSLFWAALGAFFQPGSWWQDRLGVAAGKLLISCCICFASGMLFRWPAKTNPDAGQPITSTLPVRMFFWGAAGISVLFGMSWYLVCGAPCLANIAQNCVCR
jgi:hypothetical protein